MFSLYLFFKKIKFLVGPQVTIAAVLNHPNIVRYITAWLQDSAVTGDGSEDDEFDTATDDSYLSTTNTGARGEGEKNPLRTFLFIQMEVFIFLGEN